MQFLSGTRWGPTGLRASVSSSRRLDVGQYAAQVTRRSYSQYCGLARALDLVGERWTLLLVRDLAVEPRRFTDLLAGLQGMGTSLLSERLRNLEEDGIVRRVVAEPPSRSVLYALTDSG